MTASLAGLRAGSALAADGVLQGWLDKSGLGSGEQGSKFAQAALVQPAL